MATRRDGVKAKTPKLPKRLQRKPVTVSSDLRKVHTWFADQSKGVLDDAVLAARRALKKEGPKLSGQRLELVATIVERLQLMINPLEERQARLVKRLKVHYGHTGETQFKSPAGTSLISTSASLVVDAEELRRYLSVEKWNGFVESVLNPELLLLAAGTDESLKVAILRATTVSNLRVTVTPGNSRRPKSGKPGME